MGFLNDHKIQYKNNLDFKKKSYLLHICIENIEKAIDNKVFVCGVFLTYKKHLIQLIMAYSFINFHIME